MINSFYNSLAKEEQKAIDRYKSNLKCFAYIINDTLRGKIHDSEFAKEISLLDSSIAKYKISQPLTLHRATTNNNIAPFIFDEYYRNPEFLSTGSSLESIQTHFTNKSELPAYMIIKCPVNSYMAPMESNPVYGGLEDEFLLGRNNCFKIIMNEVVTDKATIAHVMEAYSEGVNEIRIYKLELLL